MVNLTLRSKLYILYSIESNIIRNGFHCKGHDESNILGRGDKGPPKHYYPIEKLARQESSPPPVALRPHTGTYSQIYTNQKDFKIN